MDFQLEKFKKRFDLYLEYQNKLPGVEVGLDVLRFLQAETLNAVLSKDSISKNPGVLYYDFIENKLESYCYNSLNLKLNYVYNYWVLNNKKLSNNNFYSKICVAYDNVYSRYQYKYKDDVYTKHDILSKFFQGLRTNQTDNFLKYYIYPFIVSYKNTQYFEQKVSGEEFYLFMFEFILELEKDKILNYVSSDYSMVFNSVFHDELQKLQYFSFEMICLGKSNIHENFNVSNFEIQKTLSVYYDFYISSSKDKKMYVNDLLTSFVIASSAEFINADLNINNILIEKLSKKV